MFSVFFTMANTSVAFIRKSIKHSYFLLVHFFFSNFNFNYKLRNNLSMLICKILYLFIFIKSEIL